MPIAGDQGAELLLPRVKIVNESANIRLLPASLCMDVDAPLKPSVASLTHYVGADLNGIEIARFMGI